VRVRKMLTELLDCYYECGWVLCACTDLDRSSQDASDLFFRQAPPKLPNASRLCCVSLNRNDSLRLINSPQYLAPVLENCVKRAWPSGIQKVSTYGGAHEVKCSGNPWLCNNTTTVHARLLIAEILRGFEQQGWVLYADAGMQKTNRNLHSLYFQQIGSDISIVGAGGRQYCSISMSAKDRLRIMPQKIIAHLVPTLRNTIKNTWGVIQSERRYGQSSEFKLKGYPWYPSGQEGIRSRLLILDVVSQMARQGWILACATDLTKKESGTSSLIFCNTGQPIDVQCGAIVPVVNTRFRIFDLPCLTGEVIRNLARQAGIAVLRSKQITRGMEYTLSKYLWSSADVNDQVAGRIFIMTILNYLQQCNYFYIDAIDTSKKMGGSDDHRYPIDASMMVFANMPLSVYTSFSYSNQGPPPAYNFSAPPPPYEPPPYEFAVTNS